MARLRAAAIPLSRRRARRALDARSQAALSVLVALSVGAVVLARHLRGTGAVTAALDDAAVALAVASALGVLGVPAALRRGRRDRAGIDRVDQMTGEEFEARLALLFSDMGAQVQHTGRRGDFGADLVTERDGVRTVVQAKRYDGAVGIEAVQQVIGARRYYDAAKASVVTNSFLTPAALALARADGVEVVERDALVSLLAGHPDADRAAVPWALLRQVADGAVLVGYAALVAGRAIARTAWWLFRVGLRGVARMLRRS